MKSRPLLPPVALRSSMLPWNPRAVLPPDNKERRRHVVEGQAVSPPVEATFPLVDLLVEDVELTRSKACLAIRLGHVSVNEIVIRDPDAYVKGTDVVRFFPSSNTHVQP